MNHKVGVSSFGRVGGLPAGDKALMRRCARETLVFAEVPYPCEVQILYTDDRGIQKVNHAQRGVDAPTDVLSFPAFELRDGQAPIPDPETGRVYLGDILISVERVRAQAETYGHSVDREAGYLVVHGMLHLLGYDHKQPVDKRAMRTAEEAVMQSMELRRAAKEDRP